MPPQASLLDSGKSGRGAKASALQKLLDGYRSNARSEREKGNYFEELIRDTYLRHEPTYRNLYSDVWLYADWAREMGLDGRDVGIDLVARTEGAGEYHAIQCKFFAPGHTVQKRDIDSFFTASGKEPFSHRIIVTTTDDWSSNAEDALVGQRPQVQKITLHDLENSLIDWERFEPGKAPVLRETLKTRPHQDEAIEAVVKGLQDHDRGKLIMACGTGKTLTSLRIAEKMGGGEKEPRVLFLVPSLNLLSQTLTEWTQQSAVPIRSYAVCSDRHVGKRRKRSDDVVELFTHELRYPATTDGARLEVSMRMGHLPGSMSVVFSTYQSIDVIKQAQECGLPEFDLVICDEAHRTTGHTFENDEESAFVRVHDDGFIKARKRLYMTATPRIYAPGAKVRQEEGGVTLCSMDDESLYGPNLHTISFSEAVQRDLLCDYKVMVLRVEEEAINQRLQRLLASGDNNLRVDDASRIVGCWKALAKIGVNRGELGDDDEPMRRAVAFCQVIEARKGSKTHKVSSKEIAEMFEAVVEEYQKEEPGHGTLACVAEHIDGTMNASQKDAKLQWLKSEPDKDTCHILSNVRCLSEGVDVPALDAVLFLTPRNSQVDVVQSVGRVMRKSPGKKRGYVLLPVVIPAGMSDEEALESNKVYKVVWEVLQALRSHDDEFDSIINKADLMERPPEKMEVVCVTDLFKKNKPTSPSPGDSKHLVDPPFDLEPKEEKEKNKQGELDLVIGELERAIYAKIVRKVGNRMHWEEWASDIAKIAQTHISRINIILKNPKNIKERQLFEKFTSELKSGLNNSITESEVIEMLAQHEITKPVFNALFESYDFAKLNPVSKAMENVLIMLNEHHLDKERLTLQKFYSSVKIRAQGIDNALGKQKIIVELYEKFFRYAFPKMAERLGLVYTPTQVVDFIINSVNGILVKEFNQSLGSKGVHIFDPFIGTGTFLTRILQSGLIAPNELLYKYKNEFHANEIVLLAYYIAAINIENAFYDVIDQKQKYIPFKGICLSDTFQMYEKSDRISYQLEDNSDRLSRQKELDIRVIIGNPPYSVGQKSGNDDNQNIEYPYLDRRISDTYAAKSSATLKRILYDSYIRAFRWASDRIDNQGIIGFVSNASYLDSNSTDGMRKCLAKEFSSIYI